MHDENSNFGLLNNQEDRWVTFKRRVQGALAAITPGTVADKLANVELQEKAPEGVVYKVLFCGESEA